MNWIPFAIFGAMFQAVEAGIKKKALQVKGMNNVVAVIAFFTAGTLFALAYYFQEGTLAPVHDLSGSFWSSLAWMVGLNIIAVWFNYKALDAADLSYLMPFMTLTSLSLIIPPMILLGEYPSAMSFLGIAIVVFGALAMDWKFNNRKLTKEESEKRKNNRKGVLFFLATAVCYTFTPTFAKVLVVESGSVLFASYTTHLLIAIGFIPLIFLIPISGKRSESLKIIKQNLTGKVGKTFVLATVFAGVAIAIANGSINYALQFSSVANVFAIKRTMPLFAFLIGVFYFKEHSNLKQKIIATLVMVAGAVIITYSK
jgi:drug/metabolite transporter (DMT)-like permease